MSKWEYVKQTFSDFYYRNDDTIQGIFVLIVPVLAASLIVYVAISGSEQRKDQCNRLANELNIKEHRIVNGNCVLVKDNKIVEIK